MSIIVIPKVTELASAARAEAEQIWAGMKHTDRLTEKGRAEKWRKLIEPTAARLTAPYLQPILNEYRWTYDEMSAASEVDFTRISAFKHPPYVLQLFLPGDVIWCGDTHEAREENFRTREEWLACKEPIGPFTCGSIFTPGVYTRKQTNALAQRFLIVESDTLDYAGAGAIYRWLREENGLTLHAIVDTGGKSLHAWYDYPGAEMAADLKLVLPALGCDKRMFVPTQPCRMPGTPRGEGRFQRLIYIA